MEYYVCTLCDAIKHYSLDMDDLDYFSHLRIKDNKIICSICLGKFATHIKYDERPFSQRLVQLEKRVEANQIGLDNVYKEFQKVTKPKDPEGWISISDRTPATLKMVQVSSCRTLDIGFAIWHGNLDISDGWAHHTPFNAKVTHWMYIPKIKD